MNSSAAFTQLKLNVISDIWYNLDFIRLEWFTKPVREPVFYLY